MEKNTTPNHNGDKCKIISVLNHKGGIGKTTSCLSLAAAVAALGNKVLILDTDPQANLSQALGLGQAEVTIYDTFSTKRELPIYRVSNLDIVPSNLDLAEIEIQLVSRVARESFLKKAIEPFKKRYDYIFIDCPPSLGILVVNSMVASDHVIIPIEAELFAYKAINNIVKALELINLEFDKNVTIAGVFINKYNPRKLLTQNIEERIKEQLGDSLCDTKIRTNQSLPESQAQGQNIFDYAPNSSGAKDYMKLANELINKNRI